MKQFLDHLVNTFAGLLEQVNEGIDWNEFAECPITETVVNKTMLLCHLLLYNIPNLKNPVIAPMEESGDIEIFFSSGTSAFLSIIVGKDNVSCRGRDDKKDTFEMETITTEAVVEWCKAHAIKTKKQ